VAKGEVVFRDTNGGEGRSLEGIRRWPKGGGDKYLMEKNALEKRTQKRRDEKGNQRSRREGKRGSFPFQGEPGGRREREGIQAVGLERIKKRLVFFGLDDIETPIRLNWDIRVNREKKGHCRVEGRAGGK